MSEEQAERQECICIADINQRLADVGGHAYMLDLEPVVGKDDQMVDRLVARTINKDTQAPLFRKYGPVLTFRFCPFCGDKYPESRGRQ